MKNLAGTPANEQEIYNLAADILGNSKGGTDQDMQKMLERAKANPEEFARSLTPEQRKKLEDIAKRIPAAHKVKP